jgi:hypothetical protein
MLKSLARSSVRHSIALVSLACLITGCTTTSPVANTGVPEVYSVSASAKGGVLSWARAHDKAVSDANDFCAARGMQVSLRGEFIDNGDESAKQVTEVTFECHQKF